MRGGRAWVVGRRRGEGRRAKGGGAKEGEGEAWEGGVRVEQL